MPRSSAAWSTSSAAHWMRRSRSSSRCRRPSSPAPDYRGALDLLTASFGTRAPWSTRLGEKQWRSALECGEVTHASTAPHHGPSLGEWHLTRPRSASLPRTLQPACRGQASSTRAHRVAPRCRGAPPRPMTDVRGPADLGGPQPCSSQRDSRRSQIAVDYGYRCAGWRRLRFADRLPSVHISRLHLRARSVGLCRAAGAGMIRHHLGRPTRASFVATSGTPSRTSGRRRARCP